MASFSGSLPHVESLEQRLRRVRLEHEAELQRLADEAAANAEELSPAAYLHDLAERLMRVPVSFGVDGYDIDRLSEIARSLDEKTS
jgi:hypothetical protein